MPATSKAQQMAAGAELRRRKEGKAGRKFEGMSTSSLEHLAATSRKGLPFRSDSAKLERRRKIAAIRGG